MRMEELERRIQIPWLWSLTFPSDTIRSPTNRTLFSLAFCLGIKDSYYAGPVVVQSKRDTISNPSGF